MALSDHIFGYADNGDWCDTLKSSEIGYARSGSGAVCREEKLYRGRDGRFFFLGLGGPDSPYAKNGHTAERLLAVSETDARTWVYAHLGAEKYKAVFGEDFQALPEPLHKTTQPAAAPELAAALETLRAAGFTVTPN